MTRSSIRMARCRVPVSPPRRTPRPAGPSRSSPNGSRAHVRRGVQLAGHPASAGQLKRGTHRCHLGFVPAQARTTCLNLNGCSPRPAQMRSGLRPPCSSRTLGTIPRLCRYRRVATPRGSISSGGRRTTTGTGRPGSDGHYSPEMPGGPGAGSARHHQCSALRAVSWGLRAVRLSSDWKKCVCGRSSRWPSRKMSAFSL